MCRREKNKRDAYSVSKFILFSIYILLIFMAMMMLLNLLGSSLFNDLFINIKDAFFCISAHARAN